VYVWWQKLTHNSMFFIFNPQKPWLYKVFQKYRNFRHFTSYLAKKVMIPGSNCKTVRFLYHIYVVSWLVYFFCSCFSKAMIFSTPTLISWIAWISDRPMRRLLEMSYTPPTLSECSPWIPTSLQCTHQLHNIYYIHMLLKSIIFDHK